MHFIKEMLNLCSSVWSHNEVDVFSILDFFVVIVVLLLMVEVVLIVEIEEGLWIEMACTSVHQKVQLRVILVQYGIAKGNWMA